MIKSIHSELLKQKHCFTIKLLWLSPLVPLVLALALMGGSYLMAGTYNWWYTMILPGTLAMLVTFGSAEERKHNRHGLFSVCVDKGKLWVAQVIVNTLLLFVLNLIFYCFVAVGGLVFGSSMPYAEMLLAVLILVLTYMWQIPALMWVSEKAGTYPSIFLCLLCNVGAAIFLSPTRLWLIPFGIPARLMCAVIKVHPNGVPLEAGQPLCDNSVVPTGLAVTVLLYVAVLVLTVLWFRKREVQ